MATNTKDDACSAALTGGGRPEEFREPEQEAERRLLGNNGWGHLSCVAALPFAYNGSRGPASGGFLFGPLLSGDTSDPYNGAFVPTSLFANI